MLHRVCGRDKKDYDEVIFLEELKHVIAKNITELRKTDGITQLELAESLNYSDKAVSKWERGESLPDISVLKTIADKFEVTVDYLLNEKHDGDASDFTGAKKRKVKNRTFITLMSLGLVWLIATAVYVIVSLATGGASLVWYTFMWAVPVTFIVWLVFNSVWFNPRLTFLIVSLLMWSMIASLFLTLVPFVTRMWMIFFLGIPGQCIIFFWSRIKKRPQK